MHVSPEVARSVGMLCLCSGLPSKTLHMDFDRREAAEAAGREAEARAQAGAAAQTQAQLAAQQARLQGLQADAQRLRAELQARALPGLGLLNVQPHLHDQAHIYEVDRWPV